MLAPDDATEFDRQAATLVARGYASAAGLSDDALVARLAPLRARAAALAAPSDVEAGRFAFAIVVPGGLVDAATAIALVRRRDRAGVLAMLTSEGLAGFAPIEQVALPGGGEPYLVTGIETGADNRNVTPDDALAAIGARDRSPLTIDEGIALVTQFPEAVATNGGFSLAGSRCGDRRVCALWIAKGAPKLGWCWAGNPHTWLGTASCAGRLSA